MKVKQWKRCKGGREREGRKGERVGERGGAGEERERWMDREKERGREGKRERSLRGKKREGETEEEREGHKERERKREEGKAGERGRKRNRKIKIESFRSVKNKDHVKWS